eukprot:8503823-Pyramimonas_sp.AAC.1
MGAHVERERDCGDLLVPGSRQLEGRAKVGLRNAREISFVMAIPWSVLIRWISDDNSLFDCPSYWHSAFRVPCMLSTNPAATWVWGGPFPCPLPH